MEKMTGFYPVVMSEDVETSSAFYVDHFGFEVVFTTDWYVSLRRDGFELALLRYDHPTIPAGSRVPVAGLLLNVEVDDARSAHRRLVEQAGLDVRLDLRDEAFGQRHFIVSAPDGVLVDVIEIIEPTAEYADAYQG
jgi:catechol 2,3-dioxygenase-like lactoylglutathione lyase family enzyme